MFWFLCLKVLGDGLFILVCSREAYCVKGLGFKQPRHEIVKDLQGKPVTVGTTSLVSFFPE